MKQQWIKTGALLMGMFLFLHLATTRAQVLIDTTYVETSTLAGNLDTPWEILWGPDNWIWMTERYGRISRVNPGNGEVQVLAEIDEVVENGEGGMLGMVLHPDFADSAYVYVVYNYNNNQQQYREKLVRLTYEAGTLTDPFILLDDIDATFIHNGSRLIIDDDYKLFMTTGDAAEESQAQDVSSINGKVLRINLDGSVPEDNPFAGSYIWSWGHRNPQGLVLHPDGTLYSSEHGPANDDEINIIMKGRNYGWPEVHGFCNSGDETAFCNDSNVVEPLIAWTPTLAVCGLDYYHHDAIGEWNHSLLMTNLKHSSLVAMKLSESGGEIVDEQVYFRNTYGRLRDLCIAPDGRIFIATSNRDGRGNPAANDDRIIEIKPTTAPTDIAGHQQNEAVKIYPSHVNRFMYIELSPAMQQANIRIFDQSGRAVWQHAVESTHETLDVDFLPAGVYHVHIVGREHTHHALFIKE